MKRQYRTVDTSTLMGLKQAERLKANGWTCLPRRPVHSPVLPLTPNAPRERNMLTAYHFFLKNAGYSHAVNEPAIVGRRRCARELAAAEQRALSGSYTFDWNLDQDIDSSSFSDETPAWSLWECLMRDADGTVVASLGGIDFGRDKDPWMGDPYKRVVEAELAMEGTHDQRAEDESNYQRMIGDSLRR